MLHVCLNRARHYDCGILVNVLRNLKNLNIKNEIPVRLFLGFNSLL